MADNKLVLHPVNPRAILQDPALLLDALRGVGLIGAGFSHLGELHYKAGPRFRELIVFGEVPPAPGASDPGPCHVFLAETTAAPTFLGAANAQPPHCPACQAPLSDWKAQLLTWQAENERYLWSCSKCKGKTPVERLEWGSTGGVGRYSLDVWGVAEGQASPSQEVLAFLQQETFEAWRHFYYRF
ncbi:MAG TPA: hypothetical protein VJU18_15070 [Vicinamibacteria bacterium]|nr:hypothetical protein [Vicinamibacteria bacterium]